MMHARSASALQRQGATLVLVDYQARLMPAIHGHAEVLEHARRLAEAARMLEVPVIGTEQNPQGLGPNVEMLRQRCARTLSKMHFDACADGLLDALVPGDGDVVMAGCEAHVCLLQTALGVLRSGRRVFVVASASGSRDPDDLKMAMRRLGREGAVIVSTEMVVFEWLQSCEHPKFRQVLQLIRQPVREFLAAGAGANQAQMRS